MQMINQTLLVISLIAGTFCQKIVFDTATFISPCATGGRSGIDRYIITGTIGENITELLIQQWQPIVFIQVLRTSSSQFNLMCQFVIRGATCDPRPAAICGCFYNTTTDQAHFTVNNTVQADDNNAVIRAQWQHANATSIYSNRNYTLQEIYDVNAGQLTLTAAGVTENLPSGSCSFSLTLNRSNDLELCCSNTAKPCYPQISFNGAVVTSNTTMCVTYPASQLAADGVTGMLDLSYSMCTQTGYIPGNNCSVIPKPAKPDTVTCQDPELQRETNEVAVVGTVLGVYPNPVCQFSWFIDNTKRHTIQKSLVEYKNLNGSKDPSYFNQQCSFKVPAQNFTRGTHEFQLLAYPDVTGQDNDTVYGKNSTQTSPKYVADPSVTLECSETSIQEGKQFSCTCKETANTFILPNTTLFYGATPVRSALQHVTANVTARRNTSELVCQAQLPDGTDVNKTQTVQIYLTPDPEKGDSPPLDVGAIIGGVVAAVLVIITICVIVYLVKRKGAPCRESKDENAINSMHTIYENDASETNHAAKVETNSRDSKGSRHVLEELPEAKGPENPHYEEIIDFRSDMPEKSVHYANQISNARNEEVEYENTVSGL